MFSVNRVADGYASFRTMDIYRPPVGTPPIAPVFKRCGTFFQYMQIASLHPIGSVSQACYIIVYAWHNPAISNDLTIQLSSGTDIHTKQRLRSEPSHKWIPMTTATDFGFSHWTRIPDNVAWLALFCLWAWTRWLWISLIVSTIACMMIVFHIKTLFQGHRAETIGETDRFIDPSRSIYT